MFKTRGMNGPPRRTPDVMVSLINFVLILIYGVFDRAPSPSKTTSTIDLMLEQLGVAPASLFRKKYLIKQLL